MIRIAKIGLYFIVALYVNSCSNPVENVTEEEIYYFLNEVVLKISPELEKCDAILDKTLMSVDGTMIPFHRNNNDSLETLTFLAESGYIDSSDIEFIYHQQFDSTFILQQKKINKLLLNTEAIDSIIKIAKNDVYEVLRDSFGVQNFGYISKPFFSKDRNSFIVTMEWHESYFSGHCKILIFKKENEVWKRDMVRLWVK